jgi:glycolate oxidase FAD binding subunit
LGLALNGPTLLRAAGEPRRLLHWTGEAQAAATRAGTEISVLAQPGHGVLQVSVAASQGPARIARDLVLPLRRALEAEGGSLVIERGPVDLKSQCDVWGDISPEILAITRRIKTEFDPYGLLSPGRFVGGL